MKSLLFLSCLLNTACFDALKGEDDPEDDDEPRREGQIQGDCTDGEDNDDDDDIDCDDSGCSDKPACNEEAVEDIDTEDTGTDTEDTGTDTEDTGTDTEDTDTNTEEPINEDAPVADCSVAPNPVTPPFTAATWDGSGSYDPNGEEIVMYYWELIQTPSGSASTLPYASGIQVADFYADLAGDYVGQLTVTNQSGLTDTCQAVLEAIPSQNLWVEMFWQHSGDDMDLHLLAPGGTLETDSDCYYGNCVGGGWFPLDWGQQGVTTDDPHLDLDDISAIGPENSNIESPETSGEYTVIVHDYPGSVYEGANDVTVNIYLAGSLIWSKTKTISGEDSYTNFANINWGTQTVTDL